MNNIGTGRITGNPLCGLCERICIEVKKIFDGCVGKFNNLSFDNISVDYGGTTPPTPYLFVSAESSANAVLTNLSVTNAENNKIRVAYDAVFPLTVNFTDGQGVLRTATASVTFPRDVILSAPIDGRDYSIEIYGRFISRVGAFNPDGTVNINGCIALITKVIVAADVVIPIYGECVYPNCTNYGAESCAILFNTPPFRR